MSAITSLPPHSAHARTSEDPEKTKTDERSVVHIRLSYGEREEIEAGCGPGMFDGLFEGLFTLAAIGVGTIAYLGASLAGAAYTGSVTEGMIIAGYAFGAIAAALAVFGLVTAAVRSSSE